MRYSLILAVAGALLAGSARAQVTGTDIPTTFGGPANALATQTVPTGFGNATTAGQGGSELDQLFATCDGTSLHIGITGNLEVNGNVLVLLLDTNAATGTNVLNAANTTNKLTNTNGLIFSPGFTPAYAFVFNTSSGNLYTDYADLITPGNSAFLGQGDTAGTAMTALGGNATFAFNNSNILGIDSSSVTGAATATTGLEMSLNPAAFGIAPGSDVRMLAFINGFNGDYLSNQFLPGANPGTANIGSPVGVNLAQSGVGFATVRCTGGVIPEPGTLSLLGIGLLPFLRRKRA